MADETFTGYVRAMRVHVLVLRDCTTFVPIGTADLLRKSIALAATLPLARPPPHLQVSLVSAGKSLEVAGAGGIRVVCDALLTNAGKSDLVLVPALDPDVLAHLDLNRAVVPWLRRAYLRGADVASACTGAFLLGEAGLLEGKSATTHWAFQDAFQERYPRVRLQPQAIVVDQGRVVTAGGATSFLSLALYLVERIFGAEVARAASKMFLVDVNKSPQSAYAIFNTQKTHGDEQILRAQDLLERDLADSPSVPALARRVAMSPRNFVRRFQQATGNSPRDYIQRLRIEVAKRALEGAVKPLSAIAGDVGYRDVVAFRRLFQRWTGLSPSDYRARYGPRTAPALSGRGPRQGPSRRPPPAPAPDVRGRGSSRSGSPSARRRSGR
jgi:transcriptional regulator GlxA family with amidase domain